MKGMEEQIHDILIACNTAQRNMEWEDFVLRNVAALWYLYQHAEWYLFGEGREYKDFHSIWSLVKETFEEKEPHEREWIWPMDIQEGKEATECSKNGEVRDVVQLTSKEDCSQLDGTKTNLQCAFCKQPVSGTYFMEHLGGEMLIPLGCRYVKPGVPMSFKHQLKIALNEMKLDARVKTFAEYVEDLGKGKPTDPGEPYYPTDCTSWRCEATKSGAYQCTNAHTNSRTTFRVDP